MYFQPRPAIAPPHAPSDQRSPPPYVVDHQIAGIDSANFSVPATLSEAHRSIVEHVLPPPPPPTPPLAPRVWPGKITPLKSKSIIRSLEKQAADMSSSPTISHATHLMVAESGRRTRRKKRAARLSISTTQCRPSAASKLTHQASARRYFLVQAWRILGSMRTSIIAASYLRTTRSNTISTLSKDTRTLIVSPNPRVTGPRRPSHRRKPGRLMLSCCHAFCTTSSHRDCPCNRRGQRTTSVKASRHPTLAARRRHQPSTRQVITSIHRLLLDTSERQNGGLIRGRSHERVNSVDSVSTSDSPTLSPSRSKAAARPIPRLRQPSPLVKVHRSRDDRAE